jgi:hypothetical protein
LEIRQAREAEAIEARRERALEQLDAQESAA